MPRTGYVRRSTAILLPRETREDVQQLLDLPLPVALRAGAERVGHARFDVAAEEELLYLLERTLHRRDLEQDVDAVRLARDHPLQPLHLALDAPGPPQRLLLRRLVDHVYTLRGYYAPAPRAVKPSGPGKWPAAACSGGRLKATGTARPVPRLATTSRAANVRARTDSAAPPTQASDHAPWSDASSAGSARAIRSRESRGGARRQARDDRRKGDAVPLREISILSDGRCARPV